MVESDPGGTLFDPVRKKQVAATPEEHVRQAVIRYLIETIKVPVNLMGVEYSLATHEPGNMQRVDIVVWKPGAGQLEPWLLVECKEPRVKITDEVAFQAAGYLGRVKCKYVMLSNGADTRYLERDGEGYRLVAGVPYFGGNT
jgi:hypothetical protein